MDQRRCRLVRLGTALVCRSFVSDGGGGVQCGYSFRLSFEGLIVYSGE